MNEAAAPGGASAGSLLRAAREKQGLHIAALAAAIKVAPRKLDALENDRWDELPDATFARALAQTVCRTLKIDARAVLDLLPRGGAGALEGASGGLNAPFHDRPGRADPGLAGAAIRPMIWAAGLLMVAAAVVWLLPPRLWSHGPLPLRAASPASAGAPELMPPPAVVVAAVDPAASGAAGPAEPVPAVEPGPAGSAGPAGPAASAAAGALAAVVAAPSPPGASAAPPAASASAARPAVAPVLPAAAALPRPASAAAVPAPTAVTVQLHASQTSWVEARDAQGRVLLSRTLKADESVGLDGPLPLRLTIGNAAGTQLAFRGRNVDLAAGTRDNVARVELR